MSANYVPSLPSDVGAAGLTGPTFSASVPNAVLGGNLAPALADWTTAALSAGTQSYELEATLASGSVRTLSRGVVTVVDDIPPIA